MIRALLLPLLLLAGCASGDRGGFPSLAPRPVERLGFAEPKVEAARAVTDPELDAQIAGLRARLSAVITGFDRDAAAAERAGQAARGRAVGSEAWLTAQSSLAELDDKRAQTTDLATQADALAVTRAERLDPEYRTLEALRAAIRDAVQRQTAAIARIQALTPQA